MNPEFDVYDLGEERAALRESVRALCEKEIAPHAKEVDETPRFPQEARDALTAAGFQAIHIPEAYSGAGRRLDRRPASSSKRSRASTRRPRSSRR